MGSCTSRTAARTRLGATSAKLSFFFRSMSRTPGTCTYPFHPTRFLLLNRGPLHKDFPTLCFSLFPSCSTSRLPQPSQPFPQLLRAPLLPNACKYQTKNQNPPSTFLFFLSPNLNKQSNKHNQNGSWYYSSRCPAKGTVRWCGTRPLNGNISR